VIRNPRVIAGLKWPPERWPSAETITAMARPWANATATKPSPVIWSPPPCANAAANSLPNVMIDPAPMKISVNVPTNSAKPRRSGS
jgi:hypothetical protein